MIHEILYIFIHWDKWISWFIDISWFVDILPDMILTSCEKCTEKQKYTARKIINYMKEHKPNIWAEFVEMYDPDKERIVSLEQFLIEDQMKD